MKDGNSKYVYNKIQYWKKLSVHLFLNNKMAAFVFLVNILIILCYLIIIVIRAFLKR